MSEKQELYIRVDNELCLVSREVYQAFYQELRKEKYIAEKDAAHGVILTDPAELENTYICEDSLFVPNCCMGMDNQLIRKELCSLLYESLGHLTRADRDLIQALYFDNETEHSYSLRTGMSQSGISRRKKRILSKLRILMNSLGDFDDFLIK